MECSCRLWPIPGMYAVTSTPDDRRTRATLRSAEFGFFGVVVYTRVHTPRRWGEPLSAGVLVLLTLSSRPLRTSLLIVGTAYCLFSAAWVGCTHRRSQIRGAHEGRASPNTRIKVTRHSQTGQSAASAPTFVTWTTTVVVK